MSIFDNVLAAIGATSQNLLAAVSPSATPTGNPATDSAAAGAAIQSSAVNNQNFALTSASNLARNPSWLARYPLADVTYPEAMNVQLYSLGTSLAASTGTAHTHGISNPVQTGAWTVAQNGSLGTYLTISKTTVMDTVSVYCIKVAGTLNNVYLEIFRENADLSLTREFSTDISASVVTAAGVGQYIEVAIPGGLIVQRGERYLIRIRNSSTVNTQMTVTGLTTLVGTFVTECFTTSGATLSAQTSYTAAQAISAQNAGTTLMWGMLAAKNLPVSDQSFSDDFNHVNLGGLWYTKSQTTTDQLSIISGMAAYKGTTNGSQNALFIQSTASDSARVDGSFYGTSTADCGLILHANKDLSQIVYLGVTSSGATIYTGSSTSLTSRASLSRTSNDGTWSLYYAPSSNTYFVLFNGDPAFSWVDSGAAVLHGNLFRLGGVRMTRAASVNSGSIDNWTLKDFA